ncbi:IPT/TIG domain-containing protein, partial [Pontibacter rugosus]
MAKLYAQFKETRLLKSLLLQFLFVFAFVVQGYGQTSLTLPFDYYGPWASPTAGSGVTSTGLGADKTTNLNPTGPATGGSAFFDTEGDRITVQVSTGATKTVSFYLRALGIFTPSVFSGEFVVEQSTDNGATYTTVKTVTSADQVGPTSSTQKPVTANLSSGATRVRFRYASRPANGEQLLFDAISITAGQPEINIKQTNDIVNNGTFGFGRVNLKTKKTLTFTIENLGSDILSLSGNPRVAIAGANAGEFAVDLTNTASTVAAGSATTFNVTFAPTSFSSKTASISIASNDTDENPYVINLTGTGDYLTPAISAINPTSGYVGSVVTITGSNFSNVTGITFNGTNAPGFTIVSDNEIQVTVPAGATTGPIILSATGVSPVSSQTFTVLSPTITSFTPAEGYVGDIVTVTGTNFVDVQVVTINGTEAVYILDDETTLRIQVPTGATTGPITITTLGGT